MFGEFDRVANQVDNHLTQSSRIANQRLRQSRRNVASELESLLGGSSRQSLHGSSNRVGEIEVDRLKFKLARLNLGEVKNVVEQSEQALADCWTMPTYSRCSGLSSVLVNSSAMPMMPFIGVRIS